MTNQRIAEIFGRMADILEIKKENIFRIRAYRKAALNIENLPEDVKVINDRGTLEKVPGIGKDLAEKIREFIHQGRIQAYEDMKKAFPEALLKFTEIPGIGPKTANALYNKAGVKSIARLKQMAKEGNIKNIAGLGDKTMINILRGIEYLEKSEGRALLNVAMETANEIIENLGKIDGVERIDYAGSLRRMKETIGDIDIVIESKDPEKIMNAFVNMTNVKNVLAHGKTKSSVMTEENIQIDIRITDAESYGAMLHYLTGSKAHNVKMRQIAQAKRLKINEYGLYKGKGLKRIAGKTEESMYKALGMSYIPPELREDRQEIEAARRNRLPTLVKLRDMKGDLHMHTKSSDGLLSILDVADTANEKGYEYVVITDHSKSLKIAHGLDEKAVMENMKEIEKYNSGKKKVRLLKGCEVDILNDGKLDYGDDILKEMDFVIAAIHSGFMQSKKQITERCLRAMDNKYVNMIAHPEGRLIGSRKGYDIDMGRILRHARETNTALEINAHPQRLELRDVLCKEAKNLRVKLGIGTDSHSKGHFSNMIYGIGVARRGWLEKKDVLNTFSLKDLLKIIKK